MVKKICHMLYKICALLPKSHSKINIGQKFLRAFFAKRFIKYMGNNVKLKEKHRLDHNCLSVITQVLE